MAIILYGRNRTRYELSKEIKSGGEGVVYSITGKPRSVAKIYKKERISDPQIREATKEKILAMLDMSFDPCFNGRVIVAWPEDALFDSAGFFCGFVMPKIENMRSLIWATRPSDRAILWPDGYRWRYSVAIAFNLALTIEHIHKAGIIVGDMNTNNILIDAKGNVTVIDTDSFNIRTKTGQEYKCIVGFPEVLPAELQGKDLTKPTNQFTEKTDDFSLAVHIFNLLCNNCHPFGCLNYTTLHGSSSNPQIMDNIIKGYCPYVSGSNGQTVDDALDMDIFPNELRKLFDRAFHYSAATAVKQATIALRPSATEWRTALGNLFNAGVSTCKKVKLHEYPKSYQNGCPWCAIEKRKSMSPILKTQQQMKTPSSQVPIPVLHCDKKGKTLRLQTLIVGYGQSSTAYASTIPGFKVITNPPAVVVSVDRQGKPSTNQVIFTYRRKNNKLLPFCIGVVLGLFLLYCMVKPLYISQNGSNINSLSGQIINSNSGSQMDSRDYQLVSSISDAVNSLHGHPILAYSSVNSNLNELNEKYITYDLVGERYGECNIVCIMNSAYNSYDIYSTQVRIVYSENYEETSELLCSIIEGVYKINSDIFSREVYNRCRYILKNETLDIYISETITGWITEESGYIVLYLENGNNRQNNDLEEESNDPGYFVGTLTVVNCDAWVSLWEDASTNSTHIAQVPKWAEVDAYYYDHDWYACYYGEKYGFIQAEYLTDWPEKYEGYYDVVG